MLFESSNVCIYCNFSMSLIFSMFLLFFDVFCCFSVFFVVQRKKYVRVCTEEDVERKNIVPVAEQFFVFFFAKKVLDKV